MGRAVVDRKQRIREQLKIQGEVEFGPLATELGVSEMTIRRDIDALEDEGLARKVLGGAIALGKIAEPKFEARASLDVKSKQHIAEVAVEQLSVHETVILDSGSSALAVARAIRGRGLGLTVVTPSLFVAVELADEPDTTVLVTGGRVRPGELSLVGVEAVQSFSAFNCDVFVMGVAGVHQRGFTDYDRDESAVKRAAIAVSDRILVVADYSKIGRVHLSNIAPLAQADTLVTDLDHSPVLDAAARAGVTVLTTPQRSD